MGSDRSPLWPPGFVGAISHAKDVAVAVVATVQCASGIGVDIEETNRLEDVEIEPLVADEVERRWIDGRPARLVTLFSAKESVFKAFYPSHREYFGFESVRLKPNGDGFLATLQRSIGDWPIGSACQVWCRHKGQLVMTGVCLPVQGPMDFAHGANRPMGRR